MKDALSCVYAQIRENGIVDIGGALDIGMKEANYAVTPRSCIKDVVARCGAQVATMQNAASGAKVRDCKPIVCSGRKTKYQYKKKGIDTPTGNTFSEDELVLLVIANYRAAVTTGWEDKSADIVASAHVMAFLLGALEPGGEWKIVDDPDVTTLSSAEQAYLTKFEEIVHTGSLICSMGAINHYGINHTTGQAKLQGFAF